MVNLIGVNDLKHDKDCMDWCPYRDGTLTGDPKYCDLSLQCKQLGMRSDWCWVKDARGQTIFDYFCTGMYLNPEKEPTNVDEEVI